MRIGVPLAFPLGGYPVSTTSTACWTGDLSAFEEKLLLPLQDYALEQLRGRFMATVTTGGIPERAARAVLQMAMETELRLVLAKMVEVAPDVAESNVCERRRYLNIDIDMRRHRYLVQPAYTALAKVSAVPAPYVDLIRRYGGSAYPRYRVSSLAATLCLAAAVGA